MAQTPEVSVIIPTFNGEKTVGAAIESVFAQDYQGFELVVVNDGSTDGAAAVLDRYRDRIRIVNQENSGLAAARNAGVAASVGKYLAFLDDDDDWEATRLSRTRAALEENSDCVLVYSDAVQIDATGRIVRPFYTPPDQRHAPTMHEMLNDFWNMLPSSVLVRRPVFERCGGFETEFKLAFFEDTFFYLRCREQGSFFYIDDKLVRYRRRGSAEAFARRLAPRGGAEQIPVSESLDQSSRNFDVLIELIRNRYGTEGVILVERVERRRLDYFITFALVAMGDGDINLARQIYKYTLRFAPLSAKTYVRLSWTLLPNRLAMALGALLPARLRRALSGLPQPT